MSKFKKMIATAVVSVMVLGSMVPAFALSKDVVGTEYEDSAALLGALNIMVGDAETGDFRPNDNIKRSEFAKLAVLALGLGSAADAAKGTTQFPDVVTDHWASGYINVAAGQGIFKGDAEGTFRPDANISYAEALTVLVRALGYQDSFLTGAWPANFIAKAAELDITDGINVTTSGAASRGNVAKLLVNTLDANIVKVTSYESGTIKYSESNTTLADDKLGLEKYENARIIADKRLDDGLEANEVTVAFTKDVEDADGKTIFSAGSIKDFEMMDTFNAESVLGEEVTVYINSDDEVVFAKVENDDKAKFDYVKEVKAGSDQAITQIALAAFDDTYSFADDAIVYDLSSGNYSNVYDDTNNDVDMDESELAGHFGKFVIKNNKIVYAEIIDGNEATPWVLVTSNDNGMIKGINTTDESFELDLTENGNFDGVFAIDTDGNTIDIADIEEGNILYVSKLDYEGDDYAYVRVAANNKVEGELGKYKDDKAYIDGKSYTVENFKLSGTADYTAYYSINGGDDVKEWKNSSDWSNDMEDVSGENVVAYTDGIGRIAYMQAEVNATSGYKYGIIEKVYNESERVKMYALTGDGEGDVVTYGLEDSNYVSGAIAAMPLNAYGQKPSGTYNATQALAKGDVVKFKLNADGEIAEDELFVATTKWNLQNSEDFGDESIAAVTGGTNNNFTVENNTVIIDAVNAGSAQDTDDFDILTWSSMAGKDYDSAYEFYVFADDNNTIDVNALIFTGAKGADSETDEQAVYVIDKWFESGDDYVQYVAYDGSIAEAKVDSGLASDEQSYVATITSDGALKLYSDGDSKLAGTDFAFVTGTVYAKDGDILTVTVGGTETSYKITSKTVVYNKDDKKSTSNIQEGATVEFIVENSVNIRVLEIQ